MVKKFILLSAASTLTFPTMAQNLPTPVAKPAIEEIVVTAQKRRQNLQDIGLSVTALGQSTLAAIGRQDVTALAGKVPGLLVNQYSPTITIFNIRGVSQNDFSDAQEAPIAFYNDEVYIGALGAISGQTFDLERVEVLRGPQGTLFGRNATGGLVQIISAKPTKDLQGFLTVTGGSYRQIATEGAISGPLTSWLRARLSFTTDHHDGYIHNTLGPSIGNARFYGGRFQVEADVGAEGKLLLKAQGLRNNHETSGGIYSQQTVVPDADGLGRPIGKNEDFYGTGQGADPFGYVRTSTDPFTQSFDRVPSFDRKYYSLTGRYEQKIGDITIVSLTDYQNLAKNYGEDTDQTPNQVFNYDTSQRLYQISEELRVSGKSGPLRWLVGGYGFKNRSDNTYRVDLSGIAGPVLTYGGRQKTWSLAAFSQLEYALNDKFSAIGGLRYTSDVKTYDFTLAADGALLFPFNQTLYPDLARRHDTALSGKVELDFKPTPSMLLYASVSKGTKGGGYNVISSLPSDPAALANVPSLIPFKPESLYDYEGGFKLKLGDYSTLNGSAFYYDYKNYQAFILVGIVQTIVNRPATIKGLELEFNTRPINGLSLQLFATGLKTKVRNITLPLGRVTDRVLPQAPDFSLGGSARYEFETGPGKLALSTDFKFNSSQFFSTFNSTIDHEPNHLVANARLAYTFNHPGIEVAVFANNLTNEAYRIYNLDIASSGLGITNQTYARPRWLGGSLGYKF